jgi:protein ImuA
LEADAPGKPAFDIELLRRRGGQAGLRWRVEWDRDAYIFDQTAFEAAVFDTETGGDSAAIPGAGVSVATDRAVADDAAAFVRRTG